jgi:hypothetical protein
MDRFLIADNPLSGNNRRYIIQTCKPQAIIECVTGHVEYETPYRQYSFVNLKGHKENWTLRIGHLANSNQEQYLLVVDKLLKRAWYWYMAYLDWEDQQV